MSNIQNPNHSNKWFCSNCHTWCFNQAPKCSWCGSAKPKAINKINKQPEILQKKGTPPLRMFVYEHCEDIYGYIRNRFGEDDGDYFVHGEAAIDDPKTNEKFKVVFLEMADGKKMHIFFKQGDD